MVASSIPSWQLQCGGWGSAISACNLHVLLLKAAAAELQAVAGHFMVPYGGMFMPATSMC